MRESGHNCNRSVSGDHGRVMHPSGGIFRCRPICMICFDQHPHEEIFWYNSTVKGYHMSTKCRYCGSTNYGSGCIHSPTRKHEHRDDEKHCEWCGSSNYGSGCIHSPTRKHRHGPGGNKCIWCGSTSNGSGCTHSPTGKHEK